MPPLGAARKLRRRLPMRVSLRDGAQQSFAIGVRDPQFLEILFGEARKGRNIDPAVVETGRILSQAVGLQEVCDRGHDALQFPTRRSSDRTCLLADPTRIPNCDHFASSRVHFPAKLIAATFFACVRISAAQRVRSWARAEPLVAISQAAVRVSG